MYLFGSVVSCSLLLLSLATTTLDVFVWQCCVTFIIATLFGHTTLDVFVWQCCVMFIIATLFGHTTLDGFYYSESLIPVMDYGLFLVLIQHYSLM